MGWPELSSHLESHLAMGLFSRLTAEFVVRLSEGPGFLLATFSAERLPAVCRHVGVCAMWPSPQALLTAWQLGASKPVTESKSKSGSNTGSSVM